MIDLMEKLRVKRSKAKLQQKKWRDRNPHYNSYMCYKRRRTQKNLSLMSYEEFVNYRNANVSQLRKFHRYEDDI